MVGNRNLTEERVVVIVVTPKHEHSKSTLDNDTLIWTLAAKAGFLVAQKVEYESFIQMSIETESTLLT